jgi:hypothetical protein
MTTPPVTLDTPALGLTRTARHVYPWNDGANVYSPLPSVTMSASCAVADEQVTPQ